MSEANRIEQIDDAFSSDLLREKEFYLKAFVQLTQSPRAVNGHMLNQG